MFQKKVIYIFPMLLHISVSVLAPHVMLHVTRGGNGVFLYALVQEFRVSRASAREEEDMLR